MNQDHGTYVVPVFGQPEADGVDIDKVHASAESAYGHALTRRLFAFYVNNPHEWLTYEDMAVKFDCTVAQAKGACKQLCEKGWVNHENQRLIRLVPTGKPAI